MRVVNLEELSKLPDGTVFSEITSKEFYRGINGDMDIDGLNIMCGHSKHLPENYFNGVMHLLNYAPVYHGTKDDEAFIDNDVQEYFVTDTAKCDYDKGAFFVVYDETDIIEIINVLQWALTGCKSELLVREK